MRACIACRMAAHNRSNAFPSPPPSSPFTRVPACPDPPTLLHAQRLKLSCRGLLCAHVALLVELAPLGLLRRLSIEDAATANPSAATTAVLATLCCSCSSLQELHITVGGNVPVGRGCFNVQAWEGAVAGSRAALEPPVRGRVSIVLDVMHV